MIGWKIITLAASSSSHHHPTQASLTNQLQGLAKTPLLIGQDFEWGLGMRLDSTVAFPYAMTIGAMQGHDGLIYEMGQRGRQPMQKNGRTHQLCTGCGYQYKP